MADTVTTTVVFPPGDSTKRTYKLVMQFTNRSDGTGESGVVKVDKSTLTSLKGAEPSRLIVEKIVWDVDSMEAVLTFDRTSPITIARLQGRGILDLNCIGGLADTGTGATGDILLSTNGHSSGDTYDITLFMRLGD